MKNISILCFFVLLTSCATSRQPQLQFVQLASPFDANRMSELLAPGMNKVTGSALIRQRGGGEVTCAGLEVELVPVMAYSTERIKAIYGSDQRGFASKKEIKFQPDYPEYKTLMRKVTCDAQGFFEFNSVKDGEYYVATAITWMALHAVQGGALMQRVRLAGGETEKIVLSP